MGRKLGKMILTIVLYALGRGGVLWRKGGSYNLNLLSQHDKEPPQPFHRHELTLPSY